MYKEDVVYIQFSVMRKKGILPLATIGMDLEALCQVKQVRERKILYDCTYVWNLKKSNSLRVE